MPKRKKIPHYMRHDMSALRRLILVSWIVFITFVLFAIASVVSLLYTGKNLDKLIERNLVPAIDSSRTALDIGRSLADVNYILSVCRNKGFSGGGEAGKVLNSLTSLADDTNDKILSDSLVQFIDQFESTLTNCQSVRQTKEEISVADEQLSNTIGSLDKAVANLIIEGRVKGNDTSILERLPLSITEFMQIQLRLYSLFSNLSDVFFMKELTNKHQLILTALDDFAMETRILSGYGKEIEAYGSQIKRLLQVLIDLTVQYSQVAEAFISDKQKLKVVQNLLLKHLESAESSLHVSSQQRAKSLKKNFNWIPLAGFLLISLPLAIVLFSAQLARSAYKSLKRTWEMRDKAEEELHKAHGDLEIRVKERTAELAEANRILKDEIAERIEIERALKKREFQLTETQKVAQIGNWDLDLITPKLDWSNETYKFFDKDPENFIPSFDEFARVVHPNDLETMQTRFNNALESDETPYHVEVRITNDSGRKWVLEAYGKVTRDNNGKAISIFGTAQDVTQRSLTEALQASEKRFLDLADNSTDWIWEFDENQIITYASPSIKNLLGYSPEEMIGQSAFDPMSSPEAEIVMRKFILHKDARESFSALVNVNQHKNGHEVILESSGVPIIDNEGEFHGYRGIDRDITERIKMEGRLQQAQKMETIGTLAGGIAHDFNNILSPIVGHAELLLEDTPADSSLRDSSNEILVSALRARDLVKQILTFSRQEKGRLKLMKLQPIIKEALKLIRATIPTTINIKQDIRPDCGVIKADPTQIHQIVMNIATNAYHAMEDAGGELTVKLKEVEMDASQLINPEMKPGLYACLTIADQGVGMDKDLRSKIFDPFFTTKERGKGTGMGLSVVHGIVASMQGGIQIFSEPDLGTQFYIYFPIAHHLTGQNKEINHLIQGGTEHILLVDDEKSVVNMERIMLERLGYKVTSFINSLDALEAFRNAPEKFNVVITDQAMPNMAGDKLASELIKIRPSIPIILNTGFSDKMTPEIAASLGIKRILMKPIIRNDLAKTIREALEE